ncbi:MAG: RNA-binding protein [Anaerolineae bacterium]|nr:RNA-binding protein [Anaerolineae bacterium]
MAKKLYVGNLSYNVTEDQIRELFAQAGEITEIKVILDRDTGMSKGFAFVHMSDDAAAQDAIQRFNGHSLDQRTLNVSEARPREERAGGNGFVRNDYDRRNKRF